MSQTKSKELIFSQAMLFTDVQPEICKGKGGFVNQGTSINFSSKTQKSGSAGKNFGAFSRRYS